MTDAPKEFRRTVPFTVTRAAESGDGLTLEGYAAVFDAPTLIDSWEGRFNEQIRKGAFAKTLSERMPVLQFDHGSHPLIGSIPLGVIQTAREDEHGVFVRARLSDNWLVEPVRDAIQEGAVNGMSFRFRAIKDEWDESQDPPMRTLVEVAVPELGPVVFPAYEQTEVGVRGEDVVNQLAVRMEQQMKQGTSNGAAPSTPPEAAAVDAPPDEGTRRSQAERRQSFRRLFASNTSRKDDA